MYAVFLHWGGRLIGAGGYFRGQYIQFMECLGILIRKT